MKYLPILSLLVFFCFNVSNDTSAQEVDTIVINAVSGMQYDVVRFHIKPGSSIRLILRNTDNMEHNLLITKPGTREKVVHEALLLGENGPMMDYKPNSSDVIHAIEVLAPGEEAIIDFTAPVKEGIYPYVCTYPGHGSIMYGAMYVANQDKMPDLNEDDNIPKFRRNSENELFSDVDQGRKINSGHPYPLIPPFLYRIFMPNSSPASIAVSLENQFSYCWDTDICMLRYAWKGGFIDNTPPWTTKGQAMSKIIGTIFYQEKNLPPIRIGDDSAKVNARYKGYELIKGGYPQMHYTLNNIDVYETIKVNEEGTGINVFYRIPNLNDNIYIDYFDKSMIVVSSPIGEIKDRYKLTPSEGKQFSVLIKQFNLQ